MTNFETQRLQCFSLEISDYETLAEGREPSWNGFSNPFRHLIEGPSPLPHRIPRVRKQPEFAEIGLILAALKSSGEIVGSAGFHDFPDSRGMIEIGFGIVPERQNHGFGTELLVGMWKMISTRSDVRILRYTVSPENLPSLRIINKFAFQRVGEQFDTDDGIELIFEKSLQEFLTSID